MDDRIVACCPQGHIALMCRHHPDKRWFTKNISHIGARSIFYNLDRVESMGEECPCPIGDLIHVHEKEAA